MSTPTLAPVAFPYLLPNQPLPTYNLVVLNYNDSQVDDTYMTTACAAIQQQLCYHFGAAYGSRGAVSYIPYKPGSAIQASTQNFVLVLLVTGAQNTQGVLGFHSTSGQGNYKNPLQNYVPGFPLTLSPNMPYIVVCTDNIRSSFAASSSAYAATGVNSVNDLITKTISHECMECMADPQICSVQANSLNQDSTTAIIIAQEVADMVNDVTYKVNGVVVSDFIFPNWFTEGASAPFCMTGVITAPLTLPSGNRGYLQYVSVPVSDFAFKDTGEGDVWPPAQVSSLATNPSNPVVAGKSRNQGRVRYTRAINRKQK